MTEGATILSERLGWTLLLGFSAFWIALGMYWGRRTVSLSDHMLAGRNVGLAMGAATAVATWVTSNTTMLAPQFALQMGVCGMLAYSTASIGLFLFAPMAERIRSMMPDGYTSAEFVRLRYGQATWLVFLLISLFYALTWLISMGIAGGLLLEALSGIPYVIGMSAILGVCTLYTVVGGLKAVIGTDFIQSCVILIGVVVMGGAVINHISLQKIYQQIAVERPMLFDVFFPAAVMAVFNNLLFGLGEIFHSNVWWSRAFAMREGVGKKAYLLAGLIWLPIPISAGFIALAAPALPINIPHVNMVGPLVAARLLGSTGAILVFIVVFSSIASSIDSLLAATADLVTKEVVGRLLRPSNSNEELRRLSTRVTLGVSGFAWLLCALENPDLATILFRSGPLVGSTIWPIVSGLYSEKTNASGAMAAMVLGSSVGLVAYYAVGWYVAAVVGTAISAAVCVTWTKIVPQTFRWSTLAVAPQATHV